MEPISSKSGPAAVALTERPGCRNHVAGLDRGAAKGHIGRDDPERPAAIVVPSPSVSWLGDDVTVPETLRRRPSNGSLASPVVAAMAGGSKPAPATATELPSAERTRRLK
jgi:hypothetical protein